jgi:hypothetical protein
MDMMVSGFDEKRQNTILQQKNIIFQNNTTIRNDDYAQEKAVT